MESTRGYSPSRLMNSRAMAAMRSRVSCRKAGMLIRVHVAQDDPQTRAVDFIIARANRARKLLDLQGVFVGMRQIERPAVRSIDGARLVGKQIHQNAARVVDQIAESLRHQDAIHVAGSGLVDLLEVVIGKRLLQRDFDRRGGLAFIGNNTGRHGG